MSIKIIINRLLLLPRWVKKSLVIVADIFLCSLSTWLAFCLRFDGIITFSFHVFIANLIAVSLFLPIFIFFNLYNTIFRFNNWISIKLLLRAELLYAALYVIPILIVGIDNIPRSLGIIQPMLFFASIIAQRLIVKELFVKFTFHNSNFIVKSRALIYGAGSAGRQLASGLMEGSEIEPVAFIDDDQRLWNKFIHGLPVFSPSEIQPLISRLQVTDVLLAIPSSSRARQKEILETLSNLLVHVRILPGLSRLASGSVKVKDMREVDIDDILGREPIAPIDSFLSENITGKIVIVTGAGGSIGSELCVQILNQKPDVLILYEINEFALYNIQRQLIKTSSSCRIIPILGSVLDKDKLRRIINHYHVHTVYHTAAYKHVPMIENNIAAGVLNNVFGTLRLVEIACEENVETLVLVSTDKAVRPANVMGCTKRVAELVLQSKNTKYKSSKGIFTKLTMVRFGNVLGSSGSVIPLFREQIKNGGPVTVTHPEIIRYFMTIPEAAQLVIQAGAIGHGGDVMVLDMGEPVKILDLARRMIHLSGFSYKDNINLEGEIEILFTGLRPGEKLYEELLIGNSNLTTPHARIRRAIEQSIDWRLLETLLNELEYASYEENNILILDLLKQIVPEFNSSQNIKSNMKARLS
jgi:FlaA1/EpsC-like NDP-sugar epimerase